MKTNFTFALAILLVSCTNNTSYVKNDNNNCNNKIVDFVLKYQEVPTAPAVGFKLVTHDKELIKEVDFSNYKIIIKGAIFDSANFIMTDPRIKQKYNDTIIVVCQSGFLMVYNQSELDSIAKKIIGEISLTIYKEQKSWIFNKPKK